MTEEDGIGSLVVRHTRVSPYPYPLPLYLPSIWGGGERSLHCEIHDIIE